MKYIYEFKKNCIELYKQGNGLIHLEVSTNITSVTT